MTGPGVTGVADALAPPEDAMPVARQVGRQQIADPLPDPVTRFDFADRSPIAASRLQP